MEDRTKHIAMVIVFAIVGIVLVVNLVPALYSVTYKDVERDNDNAGWIRLTYSKGNKDVTISIDDEIIISGGDSQSGEGDTILWADSNLTVFVKDGTAQYIGRNNGTLAGELGNNFTISRNNIRTQILDGNDTYLFPSSQYAMMPDANGEYTSFLNGDDTRMDNQKTTNYYVGGLMGITAYNNINNSPYDLYMTVLKDGQSVIGAEWRENV